MFLFFISDTFCPAAPDGSYARMVKVMVTLIGMDLAMCTRSQKKPVFPL